MTIRDKFDLSGKTVIITGAGTGLGRGMALALADHGADLVGAARRLEPLEEVQALVEAKGRRFLVVQTDVSDSAQMNAMVARSIEHYGHIDVLINNAGGGGAGGGRTLLELTDEDWYEGVDGNLSSVFYGARAIVPHFLERGGGRIINIGSIVGSRVQLGAYMYSSAKAGQAQFMRSMAMTYARDNIRCNTIAPGLFPHLASEEERARAGSRQAIGRVGESDECGPAAVLLCSDAVDYLSGALLAVDGGSFSGMLVPAGMAPMAPDGGPAAAVDGSAVGDAPPPIHERFDLSGMTAIITGAGSGLGQAMALALAEAGSNIVGAGRRREALEETAAMVEERGRRFLAVPTDVTESEQVNHMVAEAIGEFGRVDVLINNAGGGDAGRGKTLPELTDEDWRAGMDVNLSSAFFGARAVMPHFLERGGGRIINVASGWGYRGGRNDFIYPSMKGGVVHLTNVIAMTYARSNVRATCISPGMVPHFLSQEERLTAGQRQPIGRVGKAEEIGAVAVFLSAPASDYVSGEAMRMDGGAVASGVVPSGFAPVVEG